METSVLENGIPAGRARGTTRIGRGIAEIPIHGGARPREAFCATEGN